MTSPEKAVIGHGKSSGGQHDQLVAAKHRMRGATVIEACSQQDTYVNKIPTDTVPEAVILLQGFQPP